MRHKGIRILSIDPATTCLGWAISDFIQEDNKFVVIKYGHIFPSNEAKKQKDECERYTRQMISLWVVENAMKELIETYTPNLVATENAFLKYINPTRNYNGNKIRMIQNALVNAFVSLSLCIHTIARVCKDHGLGLYRLAPCDAKKIATGNGHADKLTIQEAILTNPNISFKNMKQSTFTKLVEHEADAIAVGYALSQKLSTI